jgi:hypothetical protein
VRNCQQNCQVLFTAVSWVLKVEQVYLPPNVKIVLTHTFLPTFLLLFNFILIVVELYSYFPLQVLELIALLLLLSKERFVGIFILMGLLSVQTEIC